MNGTAALAVAGTMLVVLTMPAGMMEMAVTSVGLSEILPGAVPPLGVTARLLLAGFAGTMAMGGALAMGRSDLPAQGEDMMGFAFSRLTAFARGRTRKTDALGDMPVLRRADAHPDAPARRPIFASSDLGEEGMFPETVPVARKSAQPVADVTVLAMPCAPDPLDEESVRAVPLEGAFEEEPSVGFAPLAAPVPPPGMDAPFAIQAETPAPLPLDGLTIAQLAARFEHGLARRNGLAAASGIAAAIPAPPLPEARVLADIPPVPAVAVKTDVDADVDQALRAALGALQRMSAR